MAGRLQYSVSGFERAIMMAHASLVVVVEGVDDTLFYERLVSQYIEERGLAATYQVRTPKEVESNADGKPALIELFKHFRVRGKLRSSGGSKRLVFFADLDYDGISNRRLRNPHLIYSPGVSFENSMYSLGDIVDSIEAIISRRIDKQLFPIARDRDAWKRQCAAAWRDWLIYCVACELSGIAPRKNRSGVSQIHVGYPPQLKEGQPAALYQQFAQAMGDDLSARTVWQRSERVVDRHVDDDVDKVFCGKWYPHFIKGEVARLGGRFQDLASRVNQGRVLLSHLLRGLRLSGRTRDHYFVRLDETFAAAN